MGSALWRVHAYLPVRNLVFHFQKSAHNPKNTLLRGLVPQVLNEDIEGLRPQLLTALHTHKGSTQEDYSCPNCDSTVK